MDFSTKTTLGRTGLKVGRLGISSSYGAPQKLLKKLSKEAAITLIWAVL